MTFKVAARNVFRHKTKTILLCFALGFSLLITMIATTLSLGIVENAYYNISGLFYGNVILWDFKLINNRIIKAFNPSFNPDSIINKKEYNVKETTRRTGFVGRLVFNGRESTQQLFGVNWNEEATLKERLALKEGRIEDVVNDPKGIVISSKIAEKLDIKVGDQVLISLQTIKGQGNVIDCNVRGISYDIWIISGINAFAHLAYINQALDMEPGTFNEFNIILRNPEQAVKLENDLESYLNKEGYQLLGKRPLSDVLNTLGKDVHSEKSHFYIGTLARLFPLIDSLLILVQIGSYILMAIMLFITGVGIANSLQLIVTERTREIGTMMALGARKKSVGSLFMKELLIVALIGAGSAIVVFALIAGISALIKTGAESSLFLFLKNGRVTFKIILLQQILNTGAVFAVTFLAGLSPVKRAAGLNPIEALRN